MTDDRCLLCGTWTTVRSSRCGLYSKQIANKPEEKLLLEVTSCEILSPHVTACRYLCGQCHYKLIKINKLDNEIKAKKLQNERRSVFENLKAKHTKLQQTCPTMMMTKLSGGTDTLSVSVTDQPADSTSAHSTACTRSTDMTELKTVSDMSIMSGTEKALKQGGLKLKRLITSPIKETRKRVDSRPTPTKLKPVPVAVKASSLSVSSLTSSTATSKSMSSPLVCINLFILSRLELDI